MYTKKNDGVPTTPFPGEPNKYVWEFHVENNSHEQPPEDLTVNPPVRPYNKNMDRFTLLGVYSIAEPFLLTRPPGWSTDNVVMIADDVWDLTFSTSEVNNEIFPNNDPIDLGIFRLITTDLPGREYVPGQIQAQGYLILDPTWPTFPVDVDGPVVPEPATAGMVAIGAFAYLLRRKRTSGRVDDRLGGCEKTLL